MSLCYTLLLLLIDSFFSSFFLLSLSLSLFCSADPEGPAPPPDANTPSQALVAVDDNGSESEASEMSEED